MLTYTTLQERPREFLAATGLTHAEFAHLLPAFATAYALLYPPEKTLEGTPRQRRAGGGATSTLPQMEDKLLFILVFQKNQSFTNYAWLTIPAEPTPDQLLDSSLAARLATGLSRSRDGAGARREPGCHQPPGAEGRP